VIEGGLAEAAFFPAMMAAMSSIHAKGKGKAKASRKRWQIDFIGVEQVGLDPNREFSVRAADLGRRHQEAVRDRCDNITT
jgi:hypothetical protein